MLGNLALGLCVDFKIKPLRGWNTRCKVISNVRGPLGVVGVTRSLEEKLDYGVS